MTIDQLKELSRFYRQNYKSFDLVRVAVDHFSALVEVADAARALVKDDESSFRLKKALAELEASK